MATGMKRVGDKKQLEIWKENVCCGCNDRFIYQGSYLS